MDRQPHHMTGGAGISMLPCSAGCHRSIPGTVWTVPVKSRTDVHCIGSAPLAGRMHWRLDEYGAESSRWRRLQAKVAGFPARVAASNHRPDRDNSHRDAPRLTVSQSLAAVAPAASRERKHCGAWIMTNLLLCLTAQRQIRISAALIPTGGAAGMSPCCPWPSRQGSSLRQTCGRATSPRIYGTRVVSTACGTGADFLR